ncbi:carbohydrate ABC transporter permease [Aestuariibius sp. HNIBRBA575]|uniref:carbohydrate ABC transporter permease n=1 Tax=Aestuariibius sp. HNIBRBA575 TaxID=3233343 RepID=UPI0034A22069
MTPMRQIRSILIHAFVLALVVTLLMPLLYMLTMSFRTATEIAAQPLGLPDRLAWENYTQAFTSMNYLRSVANSVGITVSVTMLTAMLGSMAAFPLARNSSRVARGLIMLVALGLATPNFVTITPIFVIFRELQLLDTYLGIILAFTALNLPLAIFFYVGFIAAIPKDLIEAAKLDHCSDWQIFWHVIRPLLGPATATLSLFVMLMVWNDFTYPLLLLTDKDKFTVTISVYRFVGNQNIQPDMLFPAAVLGSLPLLILFAIFQRRIVAGVTAGAVK